MSLHLNGDKMASVFLNGDSWKKAYLNGDLIFSKGTPVPLNFLTLWWKDTSNIIHEESIETTTDLNKLCSITSSSRYQINLSNGHTFYSNEVVDMKFGNSSQFPVQMPDYFGRKFNQLNIGSQSGDSTLVFPDSLLTIGDSFMELSTFDPTSLDFNNVTSIGDNFCYQNQKFNAAFINSLSLDFIGDKFLCNCRLFNKPIVLNPTSIGTYFLANDGQINYSMAFNQPLNIGSKLKDINNYFLAGVPSHPNVFNNTLTLPSTLETIGNRFLYECNYSGTIDLSNTQLYSIGDSFNENGKASSILLPTINQLSIGDEFCYQHQSILSQFTIPSNVSYIGDNFFYPDGEAGTYVCSNIVCNADPSSWGTTGDSFTYYKLTSSPKKYLQISGTYASQFKSHYPQSNGNSGFCRYYS